MSKKCIVAINEVDFGSTGNITFSILDYFKKQGFETYFACHELTKKRDNEFQISVNKFNYFCNKVLSRIDASDGFHSKRSTKRLIKFLDEKKPGLLLLGNLHGSYLNIPLLFEYIRKNHIKCIYTLHDCWSFTGKCAHFLDCECDKWKTHCEKCPNLHSHPKAYFFDHSSKLFDKKKKAFLSVKDNLFLVTPSNWLEGCVKNSYLKDFKIKTINNGIANNVEVSKIYEFDLANEKRIILFSAGMPLIEKKGINYINKLANELDPNIFLFIAAGVPSQFRKSINVKYIDSVKTREEMNYLYSFADYFLNPSLEENFPSTNIESLQCGTPIIAFDAGGNAEVISKDVGEKIKYKNFNELKKAIESGKKKTNEISSKCRTVGSNYSNQKMVEEYYRLFESLEKC